MRQVDTRGVRHLLCVSLGAAAQTSSCRDSFTTHPRHANACDYVMFWSTARDTMLAASTLLIRQATATRSLKIPSTRSLGYLLVTAMPSDPRFAQWPQSALTTYASLRRNAELSNSPFPS